MWWRKSFKEAEKEGAPPDTSSAPASAQRQRNEGLGEDPVNLFMSGCVRRPGRPFDNAVQAEADQETDPATMDTRPSALL